MSADLAAVTLASQLVSADTVYTSGETRGDPLFAAAGRLDWFSSADQVVVAYTAASSDQQTFWYPVAVVTLNSQLQISQASSITTGVSSTPLALGNFNFDPDLDSTTEQVNWAQGGGSQVTHGSSQTNSLDVSVSVSDSATAIGDFFTVGASGSASFSTNLSASVATLNSTEESMGESTGVGMTTASTFLDPANYQYGVTPLISGQIDPPGTLQTVHPATDHQSTGILRAIFTAGPTDSGLGAGPWWGSTYTLPDLALNHPARCVLSTQTSSPNENPPSHCDATASPRCIAIAPRPGDLTGRT